MLKVHSLQEKGAGYTRLEELQLKEVNTQVFNAVNIELLKYATQHGIWGL